MNIFHVLKYFIIFFNNDKNKLEEYKKNVNFINIRTSIYSQDKLTISWSSNIILENPILKYGLDFNNLNISIQPKSIQYIENSIHYHAITEELNPFTKYYFQIYDDSYIENKENKYTFISNPVTNSSNLRIAIYGDMGVKNSNKTMEKLKNRNINMFLHIGDISYADDKGFEFGKNNYYESTYDSFLNSVSIFSKNSPYMVCPGNHDITCHSITDIGCPKNLRNFTAFNSRFKMPSDTSNGVENMWYSFDYGPIHFVSINTESDYPNSPINPNTFIGSGAGGNFGNQLKWLENDLEKANNNRINIPWIILYGHRPMYDKILFDWPLNAKKNFKKSFENIFIKYKIDIYFAGHIHAYERNSQIVNGKRDDNGPYHITIGSPGCEEKPDKDYFIHNDFTEYYNYKDLGWGELIIHNSSVLEWNFIKTENENIEDSKYFYKN
jgi:hypothetical protein